jgi:hypothetical protein
VEESPVGHKVRKTSAKVRSLCELEWGKRERRGQNSLDEEACERRCLPKKRGRVRYGDEGRNREPTRVPGKERCTVQGVRRVRRHAVATLAWHTWAPPPTVSAERAVIATRQV